MSGLRDGIGVHVRFRALPFGVTYWTARWVELDGGEWVRRGLAWSSARAVARVKELLFS